MARKRTNMDNYDQNDPEWCFNVFHLHIWFYSSTAFYMLYMNINPVFHHCNGRSSCQIAGPSEGVGDTLHPPEDGALIPEEAHRMGCLKPKYPSEN